MTAKRDLQKRPVVGKKGGMKKKMNRLTSKQGEVAGEKGGGGKKGKYRGRQLFVGGTSNWRRSIKTQKT